MKIGILTMNYNSNYGGILQCVALQNTLIAMGHEVEVIKYSSNKKGTLKRRLKLLFMDFSLSNFYEFIYNKIRDRISLLLGKQKKLPESLLKKTALFIQNNINYTELCNEDTIGKLIEIHNFDTIIIGSDKIWGGLTKDKLIYFGDWAPKFKGRLISYAACSSNSHIPNFNKEKIQNLLKQFHGISVRDKHTYDLFNIYPDIKKEIVLDPTLLYDYKDYIINMPEEKYVFVYILGHEITGGHKRMLELIKQEYGNIKVKAVVLSNESVDIVPYVDEVFYDASPSEWLNLLAHSSIVYTDSFHGIIFSLKYQKHFVAYYKEANRSTRLLDLQNRMGLNQFIVASVDEAVEKKAVTNLPPYNKINELLTLYRNKSLSFITEMLKV